MSATPLTEREEYPVVPTWLAELIGEYGVAGGRSLNIESARLWGRLVKGINQFVREAIDADRAARASALQPPVASAYAALQELRDWDHRGDSVQERYDEIYGAGAYDRISQPPEGGVQDSPNAHLAATPSEGRAECWRLHRPDGVVMGRASSCVRAWALIAGYKPTLEGILGYEDAGWRVSPAAPTGSASSIRSDRQEAVPHEKAPVPASSPVAPQAEPVARMLRQIKGLVDAAENFTIVSGSSTDNLDAELKQSHFLIEKLDGEPFVSDAARDWVKANGAAPQGDGLLQDAKRYRFLRDRFAGVILREVYAFDPDPCGHLQAARYLDYRTDDAIAVLHSATKDTP